MNLEIYIVVAKGFDRPFVTTFPPTTLKRGNEVRVYRCTVPLPDEICIDAELPCSVELDDK